MAHDAMCHYQKCKWAFTRPVIIIPSSPRNRFSPLGVSAGISLVAVGWAVSIYNHALRQAHREEYYLQWPGLVLHTVWHIGVVAARVAALVAFASLYKAWVFLFIGKLD